MIYFDNSATTVPYPRGIEHIQVATKIFGTHQPVGTSATRILEASRNKLRRKISHWDFLFTSGGTEGATGSLKEFLFEKSTANLHVSDIEHPAWKVCPKWLSERSVSYAPVNEQGLWMLKLLLVITPDTILVSVMAVASEINQLFKPSQSLG